MCEMYAVPLGYWNALIFVFANASYETLILEDFWEIFLSVFANVSHETLILEGLFVSFCECLVQNAHFGRSLCPFLRMSRMKRSFWKFPWSVFANVSYEMVIL